MVVASGTLGFQAKDETYKSPYLENYLGGSSFGGSMAVLGERRHVVFGGEVSTVRFSKELAGRVVSARDKFNNPIPVRITFQETFASGLIGVSNSTRTLQWLGGAGITMGAPRAENGSLDDQPVDHWFVASGGANWLVPMASRIRFVAGVRYSYVFSDRELQFVGLGHHAIRANVGVGFGSF
jgi:hypothetical protein